MATAYDESNLILYINISQVFRIFIIPFYKAPVNLVTVLQLVHDKKESKYYIQSQDDLYQVNEFVKFFWPGGFLIVWAWQMFATFFCLLGAIALWPISYIEQYVYPQGWTGVAADQSRGINSL